MKMQVAHFSNVRIHAKKKRNNQKGIGLGWYEIWNEVKFIDDFYKARTHDNNHSPQFLAKSRKKNCNYGLHLL